MKKTLLTLAFLLAAIVGVQAQTTRTYTDNLVVTINEESTVPQETTVSVEFLESGNINFLLKNFNLMGEINVGTIEIKDLKLVHGRRFDTFLFKDDITILPGDLEGVEESDYLGPIISPIPLKLKGKVSEDKLFVTIDIDMQEQLGQIIHVTFGTDFPALAVTSSKQYTDALVVTINNESTAPQETTVNVETLETGDINFVLKNFNLMGEINVGNIVVEELMLSDGAGRKSFSYNGNLDITPGDVEGVEESAYLGPMISPIPLSLTGKITDDKLYVTIDIDMMETIGQIIHVTFGTEFPQTYTISFNVDGQVISTQELEEGAAITVPEVEEREGYTLYWRNEIPETMPAENLEIKGEYVINQYWVDFTLDGETIYRQLQDYGSSVNIPNVEDREGYSVVWDREIPETVPAGDVLVTGKYVINQYTISYVNIIDGGYEVLFEEKVDYGSPITAPEVEEREGYTFRWLDDIPATMPAFPLMITGVYEANHYTCTWMLDGEIYAEMSIPYGEVVPDMEVQGDEHSTFSGWSDVPATMPAHDVVITGSLIDGIAGVQSSSLNTQRAYNLAGQRVDVKNVRGIVIVNGKKVVK